MTYLSRNSIPDHPECPSNLIICTSVLKHCSTAEVQVAGHRSLHAQVLTSLSVVPADTQENQLKNHGTVLNMGGVSSWIKPKGKREKCKKATSL